MSSSTYLKIPRELRFCLTGPSRAAERQEQLALQATPQPYVGVRLRGASRVEWPVRIRKGARDTVARRAGARVGRSAPVPRAWHAAAGAPSPYKAALSRSGAHNAEMELGKDLKVSPSGTWALGPQPGGLGPPVAALIPVAHLRLARGTH
jgi:hypothetical protein